jgi:DNA polymerase sigma
VILFLKILLQQQDLDKPFTGGIGSYKLYVLLSHHVSKQHFAALEIRVGFFLTTFLVGEAPVTWW